MRVVFLCLVHSNLGKISKWTFAVYCVTWLWDIFSSHFSMLFVSLLRSIFLDIYSQTSPSLFVCFLNCHCSSNARLGCLTCSARLVHRRTFGLCWSLIMKVVNDQKAPIITSKHRYKQAILGRALYFKCAQSDILPIRKRIMFWTNMFKMISTCWEDGPP